MKLSESGDEDKSPSDGASTPIEDDSGEYSDAKPIEMGNIQNMNKKIDSIKNKYDDDRNKIKTTNIQDQVDWNSEEAITAMQEQINQMREEI